MAFRKTDVCDGGQALKFHVAAILPAENRVLSSFDGGYKTTQQVVQPDRYRHLEQIGRSISRGGGYSYAPSCIGGDGVVVDNKHFDRILGFHPETGVLECEAGASLHKVFEVAARQGWYLPVQPGYPLITIGGCIAADVHGKNQFRDGTFKSCVKELEVFHPDRGFQTVSPGDEVFELTCGGFGLTGHITRAALQLQRAPSSAIRLTRLPVPSMEALPEILNRAADRSDLLYTWHNATSARHFGRGFLFTGSFVTDHERLRTSTRTRTVTAESRGRLRLQFLNSRTTGMFNRAYESFLTISKSSTTVGLFDFLFPVARKVLYFELFGRNGFHEYQAVVPERTFDRFASGLRMMTLRRRAPVTLLSCKLFRGTQNLLRFDGSGICVAVDMPRTRSTARYLEELDALTIDCGALPNISKDSRLPLAVIQATYTEYAAFRERLRTYDRERVFRSALSERLDL
jgi:decaprenylphospho-beta-D-ribofuranose 2-oxidase